MSVWEKYKSEGRHLNMLMSTTRCLNMMKAWVVDTGLIPGEAEMKEGLKTDMWGILTPNRNRSEMNKMTDSNDMEDKFSGEETINDREAEKDAVRPSGLILTPQKLLIEETSR